MSKSERMPDIDVRKDDEENRSDKHGEKAEGVKLWHHDVTYCPHGCIYQYKLFGWKDESSDPVCKHTVPNLLTEQESDWIIKEDCTQPPSSTLFSSSAPHVRDVVQNASSAVEQGTGSPTDALEDAIKQVLGETDTSLNMACDLEVRFPNSFDANGSLDSPKEPGLIQSPVFPKLYHSDLPRQNNGDSIRDVDVSFLEHRGVTYAAVLSSQKISTRCVDAYEVPNVVRQLCPSEHDCHATSCHPGVSPLRLPQAVSPKTNKDSHAQLVPDLGHLLPIGSSINSIWSPPHHLENVPRRLSIEQEHGYVQMMQQICSSDVDVSTDPHRGLSERQLPLYARYARYLSPRVSINRQRYYLSRWVHSDVHSGDPDGIGARRESSVVPRCPSAEFSSWRSNPPAPEHMGANGGTVMIRSEEVYFGTYKKI